MSAKRKPKVRTGVHVESATPGMYRRFGCYVTPYVATRADDGSFTVLDEYRWSVALSALETREIGGAE